MLTPSVTSSVLLVEDDANDEALILRALVRHGGVVASDVVVVHDGEAALAWVRDRADSELPQLVLLDVHLPRLDGFGVLRALRAEERTRSIAVVMLAGSSDARIEMEALGLEQTHVLTKPGSALAFGDAIRRILTAIRG